jgi:hypothetical protein
MRILLLSFLLLRSILAADVVIIGDSHSAGPFGTYLHQMISKDHNVVLYGHSSSAALHWVRPDQYYLSGGIQHVLHFWGRTLKHPNAPHWRTKVLVPKIQDVIREPMIHKSWDNYVQKRFWPNVFIIELGANDLRSIAAADGRVYVQNYVKRLNYNIDLKEQVLNTGSKCIWVGPPSGIKKPSAQQDVLYQMLNEVVGIDCEFFDSRKFYVDFCDGVHMSCRAGYPMAKQWASEVFQLFNN